MTYSVRSLRLYLANKTYAIGVPAMTLGAYLVIYLLIALVIGIVTGLPLPPEVAAGFRANAGPLASIAGFLISLGALAVNRNFAMALAFGSTRRHFWLGTSLGYLVTSLAMACVTVVLLAVEKLTGGWFVNINAFDTNVLGGGDYVKAFTMMLLISLLSLFLGAMFGTVYRAFGVRAKVVTCCAAGLVVVALVALGVWQRSRVAQAYADHGLWAVIGLVGLLVVAVAGGSAVANRRATL